MVGRWGLAVFVGLLVAVVRGVSARFEDGTVAVGLFVPGVVTVCGVLVNLSGRGVFVGRFVTFSPG